MRHSRIAAEVLESCHLALFPTGWGQVIKIEDIYVKFRQSYPRGYKLGRTGLRFLSLIAFTTDVHLCEILSHFCQGALSTSAPSNRVNRGLVENESRVTHDSWTSVENSASKCSSHCSPRKRCFIKCWAHVVLKQHVRFGKMLFYKWNVVL